MKDTHLVSVFHESDEPARSATQGETLVFDACHVGVVLRAVLAVQAVVSVAAMFETNHWSDWLTRTAVLTGGTLPATLAWLVVACGLKRPMSRLAGLGQLLFGIALGLLCGIYGCFLLTLFGAIGSPPWLASALAGALAAATMVSALRWRAKAKTPASTAARLVDLQSRIRPHFLFNTLNSAIALVRAEPAKAEALLEDLSDLFRHALEDHADASTLADEIALAGRYLAIEHVRFADRLRVTWALDASAGLAKLPPLLLQPLVENAVRHGVEPSDSGADVRVSTQRRGSMVVIKVTNTVPAGAGAPGHGVALANVRERLKLLHDVQGQFRSGLKDGVFQVRIEVPL